MDIALEKVIQKALDKNLITDEQPSLDLFDLDYFQGRVESLKKAFPEQFFNHAMAVKANSIRGVLLEANKLGLGGECASLQEAKHCLSLGMPSRKIIFDSPVKTLLELKDAIDLDFHMNLDNEREIGQVKDYLASKKFDTPPSIGLRINPVVGGGQISAMSTATKLSKFGLPLMEDSRKSLVQIYVDNSWLNGIHIHVGSQGVPIDKFVSGVRVLLDFIRDIEAKCPGQVKVVDIGGGLSTSYTQREEPEGFTYQKYRDLLEKEVPELFSGKYQVVTEFGRSMCLKSGTSLTRVEHVKHCVKESNPILLTHLGTNQFPREVYVPHVWRHMYSLFDGKGKKKEGTPIMVDVAGPLCFQGDYQAKDVELPPPEDGDILAIHDTGAYSMSMYCKFNSIRASPVYGYRKVGDDIQFSCFKLRESVEECLQFWGLEKENIIQV